MNRWGERERLKVSNMHCFQLLLSLETCCCFPAAYASRENQGTRHDKDAIGGQTLRADKASTDEDPRDRPNIRLAGEQRGQKETRRSRQSVRRHRRLCQQAGEESAG